PVSEPAGVFRLNAPLPQGTLAQLIGRVARTADTVLIGPHVAIGHRDGVDVRVHEALLPGHRVGDVVDVIPAARVEPDEVLAESGPNLHELEARFDLFDEHIDLDGAIGQ